ncbi:MAG: PQQ-binding-like beta-propeller repeat protein [Planctomycetia bacterium]|nr:PQQ-binding-like beta-propeller repeat protein [Planctomycetia bacterium]
MTRFSLLALLTAFALNAPFASADDWPQWLGPDRQSVWKETGIVQTLPKGGPKQLWRVPISAGYSGPVVVNGKVFVTDRVLAKGAANPDDPFDIKSKINSTERILCLDAKSGKQTWKHDYNCPYQISFPAGPRCAPTVADGKVYTLGAMGHLHCLDAAKGEVIWSKYFPKDYEMKVPMWGFCGHPLVYKNLLICIVGCEGGIVVAFDKDTGAEKWKALKTKEPGYSSPTIIRAGGVDQLVVWHPLAINGLDPLTGKLHWSVKLEPKYGMSIMVPRQHGDRLFAAGIGGAAVVLKLKEETPAVEVVWKEVLDKKKEKTPERGLYPVNMTPFIDGGTIYGVDQPGMLRAVDLETGKKLWFTHKPVIGREELEDYKGSGSGTAFIVKNADRYFLFAETGELVIAKMSPKGYEEVSRAKLLEPTGGAFGRKVVWSHPAYANKCIFVRNDKEIACFSLAAE